MEKEPRCDQCAYAIGHEVSSGICVCRRYPKTETKAADMWCGEWRDKDAGAVTDLRCEMIYDDPVLSTTDSTYKYTPDTIGGDPPKKKRGRPRKSGT